MEKPAFYALRAGGWRDYVTLLHLPYTAWHLSYVAIGAALAPSLQLSRLVLALTAFFLAVGVGAHALDELSGRPLGTRVPRPVLVAAAAVSVTAAGAIGVFGAVTVNAWLAVFVAAGVFIVVAYNLELFSGRFHGDVWFGAAWGAFPLVTGYFAMAEALTPAALVAALFAFLLSLAQRHLSTSVRDVRRRVARVTGVVERRDGSVEPLTSEALLRPAEGALRALAAATVALAVALVVMRLE
jgi:heme O synthase-like polyprenyltransferase